jgi:hypothetical protein
VLDTKSPKYLEMVQGHISLSTLPDPQNVGFRPGVAFHLWVLNEPRKTNSELLFTHDFGLAQ